MDRKATEKQIEYIKILSSYESSKEKDKKIIEDFFSRIVKKDISDLAIKEASELINKLLEIEVMFTFKCNKKTLLHKKQINRGNVLGELDLCIHYCPFDKDVNDCEAWANERDY